MKVKIRQIDNTQWINNFFIEKNYIYFTDNFFKNNLNTLCLISKELFLENIKIMHDIDRHFLSHPNPVYSSFLHSSISDLQIYNVYDMYIQNLIFIDKNIYISFIINNKVFTSLIGDLNNLQPLQIIGIINNNLIIKKEDKFFLTDSNLNVIKKINIAIINIIVFNNNYIIHCENEQIILTDLDFNILKVIKNDNKFKKIYFLNKKNILISYKDYKQTYIYNIETDQEKKFASFFINRGILLTNDLFIAKIENNIGNNLLNIIY